MDIAATWVWAYKDAHGYVLRAEPFAFQQCNATGGRVKYELQQGVYIQLPTDWDWMHLCGDRWFAGRGNYVYDITDVRGLLQDK